MTTDQALLFTLLFFVFLFLIWGRWRYDLVAFVALLAAVVLGLVPAGEAFEGFGHPAVVIIALVLVVLSSIGLLVGGQPRVQAQRLAQLRLLLAYMWAQPGKKLLFMGQEFAQGSEWSHAGQLDWDAAGRPLHAGVQRLVRRPRSR